MQHGVESCFSRCAHQSTLHTFCEGGIGLYGPNALIKAGLECGSLYNIFGVLVIRIGLKHCGEQPFGRSVVDVGNMGERLFCGDHAQTFCLSMACCHPNRPSAWLASVLFSGRLRGLELDMLVFCAVMGVLLVLALHEVLRASSTPALAEFVGASCVLVPCALWSASRACASSIRFPCRF